MKNKIKNFVNAHPNEIAVGIMFTTNLIALGCVFKLRKMYVREYALADYMLQALDTGRDMTFTFDNNLLHIAPKN